VATHGACPGIDNNFVKTHSLDKFAAKGGLSVEKNTMVSSMKKGLGTGSSVGAQGISSQDIKGDLKHIKLNSYEVADIGIYVRKNAVQLVGDEDATMGISADIAPETLGLSVVAGIGASFIFNMGTDAVAAATNYSLRRYKARITLNQRRRCEGS
jgi:hypothetical protein